MAMAWIWTGMAVVSVVCGAVYGRMEAVSAAALEGAGQAVRLCLSMAGMLCLWTGLMEVMDRCGLSRRLGRLFRPVLRRLLPKASRDPETLAAVTANVSANLLGLGNAATPMGIRAACRMARGTEGVASDELCRLVVLNTPPPSSCCPPRWPASGPSAAALRRWISYRRCGSAPCCR